MNVLTFLIWSLDAAVNAEIDSYSCGLFVARFSFTRIAGKLHTTNVNWSVSAGTITMGQGTDEITVDTVGLSDLELTATAELSGAALGCNVSASRTTHVELVPFVCIFRFDEYGDIKFEDEKARLDNFAIQLSNEPLASGYILMSAGKETFENEAKQRLDRAKSYLVKVRHIDPNRIVTVDCGFTTDLTITLRIAPPGATPPVCSNSVEIPLSEIGFTKPRPKASKKRR